MATKDTPGVVAPPPLIFLGFLVLGGVLDWLLPLAPSVPLGRETAWIIGGVLILAGIALIVGGVTNFVRAGTPVPTREPTAALVTTGVHGFSRNPIYVSMFSMYLGIGIAARSPWILLLVIAVALIIRYGVVAREERYLTRRFGDDYTSYKTRVRRWL